MCLPSLFSPNIKMHRGDEEYTKLLAWQNMQDKTHKQRQRKASSLYKEQ